MGSREPMPTVPLIKQESGFEILTFEIFRRPSQLRWGASNSLNIQGVEGGGGGVGVGGGGGEITFLNSKSTCI